MSSHHQVSGILILSVELLVNGYSTQHPEITRGELTVHFANMIDLPRTILRNGDSLFGAVHE